MQTLKEYLESLTVSEHARMIKTFIEGVPISREGLYGIRAGRNFGTMPTALKFYELSGRKVDPRTITKPGDVWDLLDEYYRSRAKPKRVRKA